MLALTTRLGRNASRAQGPLILTDDVARVVLVDVELAVHAERLRVGAQEALDVGVPGELLELLGFERAEILRAHLGSKLHLGEVEPLARASFAQA